MATLWVCRMMQTSVRTTYNEDWIRRRYASCRRRTGDFRDPTTKHLWFNRVLWATCVYLEAISVLPQLQMMQKARVVERRIASYARLGEKRWSPAALERQVFDGKSYLQTALGKGSGL